MNVVDILALVVQGAGYVNALAEIARQAQLEGRTQLTPEEIDRVRNLTIVSEERLAKAVFGD